MAFSETPIYGRKTEISVGTPVQLTSNTDYVLEYGFQVYNNQSGATVYLGDSAVTTGTGFPLAANTALLVPVKKPSVLYVIAASGSSIDISFIGI